MGRYYADQSLIEAPEFVAAVWKTTISPRRAAKQNLPAATCTTDWKPVVRVYSFLPVAQEFRHQKFFETLVRRRDVWDEKMAFVSDGIGLVF